MGNVLKKVANKIEIQRKIKERQAILDAQEVTVTNAEQSLDMQETIVMLAEQVDILQEKITQLQTKKGE